MCTLRQKHPGVYTEFCSGSFVAHKTVRPFSAIAIDQAHEQVMHLLKVKVVLLG